MNLRPIVTVFFMLVLAEGLLKGGIQSGHLAKTLPPLIVPVLIIAFVVWREWKIANDKQFAAYQAKIDSLPWEEATFAAGMFFWACVILYVVLVALANYFHWAVNANQFAMLSIITLYGAVFGAIAVGVCRFFWRR